MIREAAMLDVKEGFEGEFEEAFRRAEPIIAGMKGYLSHSLSKCLEETHKYLLLVEWETLEDHTKGFRGSPEYQEWKALLHRFYSPFPVVEHFEDLSNSDRVKRKTD
ncbi:antibiotic biosynthesis monooxygenase family protein [Bacillus amyloliquefaciens]|uniref:Antibiotic biosynthesis monooxygenase n=1 Tax=Bacillus amyloliquefaciens TaxID=1390 RepID=A0AAP7N4H7_BACAM|nr:antibiotic biosynthesis monooxygenase [Bacillus amyloliquefaciens]OIK19846.1 antibiotic biosynthesis monooxygenase [Bacillus amyloliquefaciens]